jgi:hypothetical protein
MSTHCLKVKLRKGTTDMVVHWMNEWNRHEDWIRQRMTQKSTMIESVYIDRTEEGDYLIVQMRGAGLEAMIDELSASSDPFDQTKLAFIRQTWETVQLLEPLYPKND